MQPWRTFAAAARTAALLLVALAMTAPALAADLQFPQLSGRVVDQAGLLSAVARERLTGWLAALEQAKGYQVVVVTLPSLQGVPIEDYGYQLGRAWGIGERDRDTGALLIVAPNERTVRIEVGYGLEGDLTDAMSRAIIEQEILPAFRDGDYERGVTAGTAAVLRTLGFEPADAPPPRPRALPGEPGEEGSIVPLIFMGLIVLFLLSQRRRGRRGGSILPYVLAGMAAGHGRGRGGSRGGWSGGGGGFSGGGGSFGGGGATGRW